MEHPKIQVLSLFDDETLLGDLLESIRDKPWEPACIATATANQMVDETVRKCSRILSLEPALADRIWKLVEDSVPESYNDLVVKGLNPMLRFLSYAPGDFFATHEDGEFVDTNDNVSVFTVQIYLNDEFEGGGTSFYQGDTTVIYTHQPRRGDVLIFEQEGMPHSGDLLVSGNKLCVRTEVMYGLL